MITPKQLKVYVGSWNVGENTLYCEDSIKTLFYPWNGVKETAPDVIVYGLQEVDMSVSSFLFTKSTLADIWTKEITRSLPTSKTYSTIACERLGGMLLLVFVSTAISLHHVSNVSFASLGCGFGGFLGNKGAVGVRFEIAGASYCFVNAHLPPHKEKVAERNFTVKSIQSNLVFSVPLASQENPTQAKTNPLEEEKEKDKSKEKEKEKIKEMGKENIPDANLNNSSSTTKSLSISDHDFIFWFGDLNYRVDTTNDNDFRNCVSSNVEALRLPAIRAGLFPLLFTGDVASAPLLADVLASTKFTASTSSTSSSSSSSSSSTTASPVSAATSSSPTTTTSKSHQLPTTLSSSTLLASLGSELINTSTSSLTSLSSVLSSSLSSLSSSSSSSSPSTIITTGFDSTLSKYFAGDQLSAQIKKNSLLPEFTEPPISFPPTYRFDVGKDRLDSSVKKRAPAWTDRILYKGSRISVVRYNAIHALRSSDHKPICGVFEVPFIAASFESAEREKSKASATVTTSLTKSLEQLKSSNNVLLTSAYSRLNTTLTPLGFKVVFGLLAALVLLWILFK